MKVYCILKLVDDERYDSIDDFFNSKFSDYKYPQGIMGIYTTIELANEELKKLFIDELQMRLYNGFKSEEELNLMSLDELKTLSIKVFKNYDLKILKIYEIELDAKVDRY